MIWKRGLFLGLLAFFLLSPFLYKEITHGFRLSKLYRPAREGFSKAADTKENLPFFAEPFTYLGRGMQSFVFESADQTVVIKFFKRRPRQKKKSLEKLFSACDLAFREAKEETGLVYIHLFSTRAEMPVITLKNRLGFCFSVPLDDYSFIVQKKMEPFEKTLLDAVHNQTAGPLIESCLTLIKKRSSKGICNTDLHLKNNFGFLDGQALEMDFGNFIYAPDKKDIEYDRFVRRLRRFFKLYAPEYLAEYDQIIERFA